MYNKLTFIDLIFKRKYEILLFGLLQHLFIGLLILDLDFYRKYVWLINMVVLGLSSFCIFLDKNKYRLFILRVLVLMISITPLLTYFIGFTDKVMIFLSLSFILFFTYVLYEIMLFLIKPSYINADIISAAGCGYFLLIEIATFSHQCIFYFNPTAYSGLNTEYLASTYIDFVYFSTITMTSIGFGDILPVLPHTKLLTAIFGIVGQVYSVVLVGIIISKFSSQNNH
ncbi:MAG: ion channel [Saprospiraceae bacterium]